jgi:hypothetical protein
MFVDARDVELRFLRGSGKTGGMDSLSELRSVIMHHDRQKGDVVVVMG